MAIGKTNSYLSGQSSYNINNGTVLNASNSPIITDNVIKYCANDIPVSEIGFINESNKSLLSDTVYNIKANLAVATVGYCVSDTVSEV